MPTLRFEGYSDDTFGEVLHTKDDYDNLASGRPIEYLVTDPATGLGVVVDRKSGVEGRWVGLGCGRIIKKKNMRVLP